jgi:hypothetical protein
MKMSFPRLWLILAYAGFSPVILPSGIQSFAGASSWGANVPYSRNKHRHPPIIFFARFRGAVV